MGFFGELLQDAKVAAICADGNISHPAEWHVTKYRHEYITLIMTDDLKKVPSTQIESREFVKGAADGNK